MGLDAVGLELVPATDRERHSRQGWMHVITVTSRRRLHSSDMARRSIACLLLLLGACAPQPRYIVTGTPLKLIGPTHPGLCVAIDPKDPAGIWWWDAGRTGCADRSSSTMPADRAIVASTAGPTIDASFQIGLLSGQHLQVRLHAVDGQIRDTISGVTVAAERRESLDMPERPPRK